MRWHDIITEGRDAPLFHGTAPQTAELIIRHDGINANTEHDMIEEPGISLSREMRVSTRFGPVIFQLDQRKLAQRYKIVPWDYFVNQIDYDEEMAVSRRQEEYNEAEEFLIGSITRLDRYLQAIWFDAKAHAFWSTQGAKQVPYLLDHPKLKVADLGALHVRPSPLLTARKA